MIGKTICHYKILDKLGEGGMGIVYKAQDTKLGREVALKTLPEVFSQDADRVTRFKREAKLLASLNHPNIAAIHGLEEEEDTRFLVLEMVEGETLAERLRKGALSVEEALEICSQIAEALEAAHEKGIIHRDLKPGNIKITPDSKVKVLDFGLAKAFEAADSGENPGVDLSKSPTLTIDSSKSGIILGTAPYMSPEQARGKPLDKRTDIWSFGCVLYESLTGRRAFEGETVTDIIAAIIKGEPDWKALPEGTPWNIRSLLRRCLQKEPRRRLHDIADARIEIEETVSETSELRPTDLEARQLPWLHKRKKRALLWGLVAGLVLGSLVTGVTIWKLLRPQGSAPLTRFALSPPETQQLGGGVGPSLALSPDGTRFVYVGRDGNGRRLFLREMDQLEARLIPGTEGAYLPFFSPDGQWVGFVAEHELKKVALAGGPPLTITEVTGTIFGASWGPDDKILFTPTAAAGLSQISANGGVPQPITTPDVEHGEHGHWWPEILPGGQAVLFSILTWARSIEDAWIGVASLETGEVKHLLKGGSCPRYALTGHLVYVGADGALLAVPFDPERLELKGPAIPLIENVRVNWALYDAEYTLSRNGSLVYRSSVAANQTMVMVDRKGSEQPLTEKRRNFFAPRFSPDGKRVTVRISEEGRSDIWVYEMEQGILSRLTFEGSNGFPIWTPDGKRIAFASRRADTLGLFWVPADGSGSAESLFSAEYYQFPCSWSPDGRSLIFWTTHPKTENDIWVLPLEGARTPWVFLKTPYSEVSPMLSPDGRWLAYGSGESGRIEVYVRPFPGPGGGRWQISTEGGSQPLWAPNGRELFYRSGDRLIAVAVETEPVFKVGNQKVLFEAKEYVGWPLYTIYDIHPDGKRFVMIKSEEVSPELVVVLNWFEELRRRVPPSD